MYDEDEPILGGSNSYYKERSIPMNNNNNTQPSTKAGDKEIETVVESSGSSIKSEKLNVFHKLNQLSKKLDAIGVEARGIERIQSYERSTNPTKQFISVIGLWLSGCGGLSSMSSFYLGPLLFGLGLKNCMISGMIGQAIGCAIAAYLALMGPRSGCRQMVSARFLFGWWFVRIVALAAIVGVMGWSVVNCVVGGQILMSVSDNKIPLVGGIIIISGISLIFAMFGIKQVLRFEAALAIPVNLAFLLLYISASDKFSYLSNANSPLDDAATLKGNWLSFFSLCYAITSTWGSVASDYYILFPENTPDVQVYFITFFGILLPTSFVGVIGSLIGNVAMNYQPWNDAYAEAGMGGLLFKAFERWNGGGKFLLMVIFISLISNNIINTYSACFGIQLFGGFLTKIPRWFWSIVVTIVYMVCALVGRNKFSTILSNFLPMVGYWISMYFMILLEENTIFRTNRFKHLFIHEFPSDKFTERPQEKELHSTNIRLNQHYNFDIWNDPSKITNGYAATLAFCCGVAGAVLSMSQTYWIGPIAKAVGGEFGGDVAMWLSMGFSGVVYPFLRYIELKKFGR
ncbi:uncharacterized protein KQ657_000088 [Scheffersomyces spartinae]|uniref:Vitamin B6 transporter TPN1 n=1 Tax=Scheffersomyces spartinae TaxID=45513 RepID=A0A9P7VE94_9ASCO|nr:uncharacterized protein KQ657_000088 [Scheffersomyces spartinae]KAG7196077.1 hypothetical protein KQ657_000088 [Scheffersomyces spartinae]